jgi:hypothetical protein
VKASRPALAALGRRTLVLGAGLGAGVAVARGLGVGGPSASPGSPGYQEALRALAASLTPAQRALIVLPADHPSRQITNTIAVLERPHLGTFLSPRQRSLVDALYASMLSPHGRACLAGTTAVEGRLDGCVLAIYGEPEDGRAQTVIMGGHLFLRGGGESPEGAAFGGGIAHGHQIGNGKWRVPGNAFAHHGDAANRVYASLTVGERARAIAAAPPHELVLQVQGAGGRFDGHRVGSLSEAGQRECGRLMEELLRPYPEEARARARACIAGNGGLDGLHIAFYASHGFYPDMATWARLDGRERQRRGDPYWQVWRIEGPGTIFHFQGHPHVHAYLQVVRDPQRANVGAALDTSEQAVEGPAMTRLLEGALRRATGETLSFHGPEIPGRFCAGPITTGLAYALDPYRQQVAVASIKGRAMAAPLRAHLAGGGLLPEPERTYRVATFRYVAGRPDWFGEPAAVESSGLLFRDALVEHLRAGGLRARSPTFRSLPG